MSIFEQNCKPLAKSLVGQVLKVGNQEVEILQAQGYPRTDNEQGIYVPILDMKPGSVFCPQHRGGLLFLVACSDGGKPGGCVLIRKVRVDGNVISGPGRVAEALGVEKVGSTGRITNSREKLTLHMK
ncbi:MAG: hypothetical protein WC787_01830 [Patescibacteria group bacterium]